MKNKKTTWVFLYIKYSKFWSVSLKHFVEHKPLIYEECFGTCYPITSLRPQRTHFYFCFKKVSTCLSAKFLSFIKKVSTICSSIFFGKNFFANSIVNQLPALITLWHYYVMMTFLSNLTQFSPKNKNKTIGLRIARPLITVWSRSSAVLNTSQ